MASSRDVRSLIRFGAFEADLDSGELRKYGVRIKLQDQPFQILALLLEHPGQVVTREELQRRLWPADTFVDFDRGLNKAMNRLRDALGDSADQPRFIETLPKRGYRFVGSIESAQRVNPPIPGVEEPGPDPSPAPEAKRRRRALWVALAAGVVAAVVIVSLAVRQQPALTETDTAVLADFDNRTGDPAFDYTLRQALAVDLGQSPFLRILSDQEVRDMLRFMSRKPDQRLADEVARDLCQRAGSKVAIGGSITTLGSEYVVGVNAINCLTGGPVFQDQMRASRKEDVLNGLDAVASRLRRRLGESLASIQRFDRPGNRDLTTRSFDAFRAWTDGERAVLQAGNPAGIPFYRRAVEFDSDFAMAYAGLGILYSSIGEVTQACEYTRKAWDLRDRVSEPEKFMISAQYYLNVTGELEKVPPLSRVWSRTYPRSWVPHERAAMAYIRLGQFENARSEDEQARQLADNTILTTGLAFTDIALDRFQDARILLQKSLPRNPENVSFRQLKYRLSFLQGDTKGMQDQIAWAARTSEVSPLLLRADTEAYLGHLKQARELEETAYQISGHGDFREQSATRQAIMALRDAEFGYPDLARREALAAVESVPGRYVKSWAALALAWAGEGAGACKLAEQLDSEFPSDTLVRMYWLPTIRAEIELSKNHATRALELLHATEPFELSPDPYRGGGLMLPILVRARAYLLAKDGPRAVTEFQKFLQHRGLMFNNPEGALARLGLARAYALSSDRAMSRLTYKEFLDLWKDADTDIPILREAKSEYARLD